MGFKKYMERYFGEKLMDLNEESWFLEHGNTELLNIIQ